MIETFEYLQHFQRPVEIFKEHVNTGLAGLTIRGLLNAYFVTAIKQKDANKILDIIKQDNKSNIPVYKNKILRFLFKILN